MKNKIHLFSLILLSIFAFGQTNKIFLSKFLMNEELQIENSLYRYQNYNFSNIWLKTDNKFVYGIIGDNQQRLQLKLVSIVINSNKTSEYLVQGKSMVKGNVCDFSGRITILAIRELKKFHFGIDDEFKNYGIKKQGIIIANYQFNEDSKQKNSGSFSGKLYSKWYLNKNNEVVYDDIQLQSDSYMNNSFIGTWKSYKKNKNKNKIANWGDYRVPKANADFDIGAGEISVSKKYLKNGWQDFQSHNWWE